ncbi:hypothetical protein [Paraburkholderia sp. JHI869]|uniref:hypothetical protein n=1 Tax=Paraburkholderia sp. JHI869 TaxID=3112959 RepID=UPI00316CC1E3
MQLLIALAFCRGAPINANVSMPFVSRTPELMVKVVLCYVSPRSVPTARGILPEVKSGKWFALSESIIRVAIILRTRQRFAH